MVVHIPSPLHSYTGGRATVEGRGATIAGLASHLDRLYPGLRFRIIDEQDHVRPHILLYVNGSVVRDMGYRISDHDEVHIIAALSGG